MGWPNAGPYYFVVYECRFYIPFNNNSLSEDTDQTY